MSIFRDSENSFLQTYIPRPRAITFLAAHAWRGVINKYRAPLTARLGGVGSWVPVGSSVVGVQVAMVTKIRCP